MVASARISQRAFFGVSALLFATSAAGTIVWCASMLVMGVSMTSIFKSIFGLSRYLLSSHSAIS
jgi:hypothetical protein